MKKLLILIPVALLLCNCAKYTTKQFDISYEYNEKNNKVYPIRELKTYVKAYTFADSKSQLANSKATQTDKTQGATLGSLSQEASVSTNVTAIIDGVVQGIVKVFVKPL